MGSDFNAGSAAHCRAKVQELQRKAQACRDPKLQREYHIAIELLADLAADLEARGCR